MNLSKGLQLFIIVLFSGLFLHGETIPEAPNPFRLVSDYSQTLSSGERMTLERKLRSFSDSTSVQIAVVIIKSLNGYDIESYTNKLANKWGIGQKDKRNGILLLSAMKDRQVRIEIAYGLEGAIPDAYAKRIINQIIVPEYKNGNYFEGINKATTALMQLASKDYPAEKVFAENSSNSNTNGVITGIFLLVLIILIVFYRYKRFKNTGYNNRGNNMTDTSNIPFWMFLLGLMNNKRGRNGDDDDPWGGGFSSGGNFGGFGGGGASGKW